MNYQIYCIENVLSSVSNGLFLFVTDGQAAVELAVAASKQAPLDEQRLFCLGTFDAITRDITVYESKRYVAWDTRRFESKMDTSKASPSAQIQDFADSTASLSR